jgi:hypothetical protein
MNTKLVQIVLASAATILSSSYVVAQSTPNENKPMVIDAAVVDNTYQLYQGSVVKVDKKTRTITFKNKEGESKFVAGPEIKNFDQIKRVLNSTLLMSWLSLLSSSRPRVTGFALR